VKGAAQILGSVRTGGRDDWQTPDVVLDAVRRVGVIALDPCASPLARSQFAEVNFCKDCTQSPDGLTAPWGMWEPGGLVYVNPPYSQAAAWIDKTIDAAEKGSPIILLVAARPGAKWYRKAKAHADAVAEWRGRVRFVGATHSAPFPSALMAYNISWRRFARAFDGLADVEIPR